MRVLTLFFLTWALMWFGTLGCEAGATTLAPSTLSGMSFEVTGHAPQPRQLTLPGGTEAQTAKRADWTSSPLTGGPSQVYRLFLDAGETPVTVRTLGDNLLREWVTGNASVIRVFPEGLQALQLTNAPRVFGARNVAPADLTWALTVADVDDRHEPNDTFTAATALRDPNSPIAGILGLGDGVVAPDRADYFTIPGTAGQPIQIAVDWTGAASYNVRNVQMDLVAISAEGQLLAESVDDPSDESAHLNVTEPSDGPLVIGMILRRADYNLDGGTGICYLPYSATFTSR